MTRHLLTATILAASLLLTAPVSARQLAQGEPTMVQRDESGNVVRLEGSLDARSLLISPAIDEATRQTMAPWVDEWVADVNQIAIDNLDFLEQIDQGLIDTADNNDSQRARYIQQMFVQLNAAGPLGTRLQQRGVLSIAQFQAVQRLTSQYTQSVYAELSAAMRSPADEANARNEINRFTYHLTTRDPRAMYHRQVIDSAGLLDKIIPSLGLPPETLTKIQPRLAAVRAAQSELDKLQAGLALLRELPFEQRREFLAKAVSLGAAPDAYHPPPALPRVKAPTAPAKTDPASPPGH